MNIRLELIQRAQSGDPAAVQALIESNQAIVYRLAHSLLDEPGAAVAAARQVFVTALGSLDRYDGKVAFPTWLYDLTVRQCRRRLHLKRLAERLPRRVRRLFQAESPPLSAEEDPLPADPDRVAAAIVCRLDDRLRLPVLLYYDHGLRVDEMAPMLDQKARVTQELLMEARASLRVALAIDPLGSQAFTENAPDHQRAQSLITAAGDLTVDEDARWLEAHLKECEACQAYALRTQKFEDALRAALHHRWDEQPLPGPNFPATVLDNLRGQGFSRKAASWVGAALIGLAAVAAIAVLPSMAPPAALPPQPAPGSPTARATQTFTPTPVPTAMNPSRLADLPVQHLEATMIALEDALPFPTSTPFPNNPDLIHKIYPGRLAYVPLPSSSGVLMSMSPDGSEKRSFLTSYVENTFPVWSPDGRQIAFLARSSPHDHNQVMVMDADGSHQRVISHYALPIVPITFSDLTSDQPYPVYSYGPPRWSPDGKTLALALQISHKETFLALFSVDGDRAAYLPVEELDQSLVEWSPDGRTIAYIAHHGEELWRWKPDQPERKGVNPWQVPFDIRWDAAFGLSWSPDSSQVAVLAGNENNEEIEVSLRIFQGAPGPSLLVPVSRGVLSQPSFLNDNLAWSPDGKYLALFPVFSDAGKRQILIIRLDGLDWKPRTLVDLTGGLTGFTWSPDGRWIALSTGYQVWGVSLDAFEKSETALVELASLEAYALNWQKAN